MNLIISNTDDVCLTTAPPRKAIFVPRLAPYTSKDKVKNYLAAKIPSVNLKRVSIFQFSPSQQALSHLLKC